MRIGILLTLLLAACRPALAVQSVRVSPDSDAIDLTRAVERYSAQGDRIQVSTAPGPDGIVRRIEVSALEAGAQPSWIVFALTNDSDEQLTRLIVAPHFRFVGSGVVWPDLGSSRITTITASQGAAPERDDNASADVFRLTLDPGTTVTYVAELRNPSLPQLYLWEPDAFKDKSTSLTLYEGILIGIAGLLALFLTIVFVVRGAMIFPAAAALAWAVFAYVCVDFGFWKKMFGLEDATERIWRAGVEATIAATLIVFLFAYLNLRRWHVRYTHFALAWLVLMAAVVGLSVFNAPVAAGVARISIATVAGIGLMLILSLAARGSERAVMLIPTWYLLAVWVVAAGAAALGYLTNDLAAPGLVGGLVLIVMLIGFTVMQFAFSGAGGGGDNGADSERRSLAMTGSGEAIFDWNVVNDEVTGSDAIESQLGLKRGALEGPAAGWLDVLHPLDRDRYTLALDGLLHQRSGRINHDLRLRGSDGHYFWYVLKARPVVGPDGEVVRVIGSLADVTEIKSAEERMLHDAIHDNLTGLPNRELFYDRLASAMTLAQKPGTRAPIVLVIDIDQFKTVNDSFGLSIGDSALLAVARRLSRDMKPGDTLARLSGDQFGGIILDESHSTDLAIKIDRLRTALAAPISFGEREIALTVSIGAAVYDPKLHLKGGDLLADAQLALANAKKAGGDRVELFTPVMRSQRSDRQMLENDMRRALERGEIMVLFRPIVRLEDRTVAGFQAVVRWRHPKLGVLEEDEFASVAESTGATIDIGAYALETSARELAAWQKALEVNPPIFATVAASSRQMLSNDLVADVRSALSRHLVQRGTLRIAIAESVVMENPEYAAALLQRVREIGAALMLDRFGAGYTSLSHLPEYRFDAMRIDASLVRPKAMGARSPILRPLAAMAQEIGMDVISEGAETESDAVELAQIGCQFAQGTAFGQPMSAAATRKLMGAAPG
ncbi:MAG: EAL domain-containing protein [Roseiarcus sp.]|uniref:EAL domain-containing protein n=1 Tax=Roseiarcus sp. TaxID=1969460 RepID=UPI003C617358